MASLTCEILNNNNNNNEVKLKRNKVEWWLPRAWMWGKRSISFQLEKEYNLIKVQIVIMANNSILYWLTKKFT